MISIERETSPSSASVGRGYVFVDNARFLSMVAIVMRHCELSLYGFSPAPALESAIIQFRTFGVQLFFVVSAFLMADWLERRDFDIRSYWRSRVHQVLVPWLIWVGLYIVLDTLASFNSPLIPHVELIADVIYAIFHQAYWYVPVLLFSTAVLISLRRYWGSWWLGLALALLSLFYGVNQYTIWLPTSHTIAFFGYLFPLWVGVRLFENFRTVSAWVNRLPWWPLLLLFCLTFGLTLGEDRVMEHFGFRDTYNALQISNQVYAFVVLIVLIKLPARLVPSFIDVRKDSYGIYLTHMVVARVGRGAINLMAGRATSGDSLFMQLPQLVQDPFARISLWLVWTVLVYGISLVLTKLLRRSSLAAIVGVRCSRAKER